MVIGTAGLVQRGVDFAGGAIRYFLRETLSAGAVDEIHVRRKHDPTVQVPGGIGQHHCESWAVVRKQVPNRRLRDGGQTAVALASVPSESAFE